MLSVSTRASSSLTCRASRSQISSLSRFPSSSPWSRWTRLARVSRARRVALEPVFCEHIAEPEADTDWRLLIAGRELVVDDGKLPAREELHQLDGQ